MILNYSRLYYIVIMSNNHTNNDSNNNNNSTNTYIYIYVNDTYVCRRDVDDSSVAHEIPVSNPPLGAAGGRAKGGRGIRW